MNNGFRFTQHLIIHYADGCRAAPRCGAARSDVHSACGPPWPSARTLRGNHLSSTTYQTQVFFKRGK